MKRDIHELNQTERNAVAKVFTEVRDHMIATHDTSNYIQYICTNLIAVLRTVRIKYGDNTEINQSFILAQAIINLRLDIGINHADKTVCGGLANKANLPNEQKYRVFSTPCLNYEYRIAWLESLANECLGLPFETCYIESV